MKINFKSIIKVLFVIILALLVCCNEKKKPNILLDFDIWYLSEDFQNFKVLHIKNNDSLDLIKNNKLNIKHNKIKVQWVKEINSLNNPVINQQILYFKNKKIINQLKIYKNKNELDTARSFFYNITFEKGLYNLFFKSFNYDCCQNKVSYLRKSLRRRLKDSIKIKEKGDRIGITKRNRYEKFDIITYYFRKDKTYSHSTIMQITE